MQAFIGLQRLTETLEEDIINGAFYPGEKLDLEELSSRFGCSRTPVRDALQRLEQSGLVEIRPKRGTYVSTLSITDLVQRFEVMAELEGMSVRLATKSVTAEDLNTLDQALQDCEHYANTADPDGYYRANAIFHGLFYDYSGNTYLRDQAQKLRRSLRPYRRMQLRAPHRMWQSLTEHRNILDAVAAGSSRQAGELARKHVLKQATEYGQLARTWGAVNSAKLRSKQKKQSSHDGIGC